MLALSDVGEVVFLPSILQQLRREAPAVSLRSVSLPADEVAGGLEGGTIDLALGYFPNLKRHNFFQQTLFSDSFTCLIRADHPVKSPRLSPKQFRQLDHAVMRAESRTEEVIERFLARRRIQRRVTLTTPHFASVPPIVEQSDLVVTVPVPLARYFSTVSAGIRIVRPPFEPPRIDLKQIWHRKFHHDARKPLAQEPDVRPVSEAVDRKLSAKTATPRDAAKGTMYCTTPAALVPPPMSWPASSGPAIDPMRPTAMLAPEPVPRMARG